MIIKSPRLFPFGDNVTQFVTNSDTPKSGITASKHALTDRCVRLDLKVGQIGDKWDKIRNFFRSNFMKFDLKNTPDLSD